MNHFVSYSPSISYIAHVATADKHQMLTFKSYLDMIIIYELSSQWVYIKCFTLTLGNDQFHFFFENFV